MIYLNSLIKHFPVMPVVSYVFLLAAMALFLNACGLEEVDSAAPTELGVLEGTVKRVGPPEFSIGVAGGEFYSTLNDDPKTFNTLTARDADSRAIIDVLTDTLADYDPYTREFTPLLADFEIEVAEDTLRVIFTLREDLYWTSPLSEEKVQMTADDFIFWYDEVEGDPVLQHPGYPGQFVEMEDGSMRRIEIQKIDTFTFAFLYPRIVANPILSSNMQAGPRYIFQKAKEEGGVEAMLNLFSADVEVQTIPSLGPFHVWEYTPGVRVVLKRNPHYWKKDEEGNNIPYMEYITYKIAPDQNTEFLLFRNGEIDSYTPRPEDLETLLEAEEKDYTVYEGGTSLASAFFCINQNPHTVDPIKFSWFSKTEFRQAMSSLLDRSLIVQNVYRGLAEPAHHFFATPNPYFDPELTLEYTFDPEKALQLLDSIDISPRDDGLLYDAAGNHIEFDLFYGNESTVGAQIASIYVATLREIGITVNLRGIDFQNLVARLTQSYDWDMVQVSLGANYWPSGGSNVWQSNGNFHLWYPLQETPATEWESRIDYLYNKGRFTLDQEAAKEIYDEYQHILLTELPVIYIAHPYSYYAIRDKWKNVFFDTLGAFEAERIFLVQ